VLLALFAGAYFYLPISLMKYFGNWKTKWIKSYKYVAGIILILFSMLIGFSRIYLRENYASDVVAGFCIGFAWLSMTIWLFECFKKKSDNEVKFENN
jgi:undecaprenyl-diphosphatase